MGSWFSDLRFACRSLLRERGFSAAALATLAAGMALFLVATSVTRAYLLRDLPYPAAERLYQIRYAGPGLPLPRGMDRLDWASLADIVEHPVAWDLDAFYLLGGEHAETARGAWVTPGFLDALGVSAAMGRAPSPEAFVEHGPNEVLISHRLWQSRFGGAADVVGAAFTAYVADRPEEAERFTVVGVLPATFWHFNAYTDVLAPLRGSTYPYMARLRPGVEAEVFRQRITALVRTGATEVPEGWSASVVGLHEAYVAGIRPALRAVLIAGALVLLVACANLTALLLVRAVRRRQEVAIRTALGAGTGAIVRLLAAEAWVLGAAAAVAASLVTAFALDTLAPIVQNQIGRPIPGGLGGIRLDWQLAAAAIGLGIVTASICSLAPLSAAVRPRVAAFLQSRGRAATAGPGSARFRASLIAAELAASLALLAGAGLMFQSAQALGRVDLGIQPQGLITGSLTLRQARYPEGPSRVAAYERLAAAAAAAPDVEAVAFTSMWPLQQAGLQPLASGSADTRAAAQLVGPGYFETLGIPIRAGRSFTPEDRHGAEPVVIVSQTLASRLWPGGDAVGQLVALPPPHTTAEPALKRLVVGVAADVRQGPLDDDLADAYVPLFQEPGRFAFALLRSPAGEQTALKTLRAAVREVDPEIAVDGGTALAALAAEAASGSRLLASLLGGFATVAALLSLVGVYGAIAYTVRQREREIAVRVAIGADPHRIVSLYVRQGAAVVVAGLALGVPAAFAVGRLLDSQLFGVTPADPAAFTTAAALLGSAALLATWWPARRAARTDPAIALRSE